MKRRDFIRKTAPAGIVFPALINGFTFKAYAESPLVSALTQAPTETDHVLVIVQLNGGNDGLNMVIPFDQYDNLANARSNIIIPKNKILKLNGTSFTGLHPSMTGLQKLFNDEKLQIIQSVGYPQPNFSHFRATDIWMTASDSNQTLNSGWAGRYLNEEYSNFPIGYPNSVMPDPLAIQIGSFVSPAMQGPAVNMGMAISDPVNFYNLINGIQGTAPNTRGGKELTYIRQIAQQTQQYGNVIKAAAAKVTKQSSYPTGNSLADQLKIVARLIAGGLKTRIYMVSIGGFDTHSLQVNANATETGNHANLLQRVSEGIKAFMDDLKFLNSEKRVIGMTFSEFGRRIKSNSSGGTDHGAAAPLFVFGHYAQNDVLGASPVIPITTGTSDNIPMQYDFRSVYASILKQWFCVPDTTLENVMLKNFQSLQVIKKTAPCISSNPEIINANAGKNIISNYPNPFQTSTTISYETFGGHALIQVFNTEGKLIKTLVDMEMNAGTHKVTFENEGYLPGVYYARLQNNNIQQIRTMLLVR
ncbi:DUF1501 domain-containing protein [Daejeonella sp. H1SJ63]|jgi:uncharacterized protein (DUF1501 family)|uniref:DUF1501 domain-containing protein n=1 Tax=Daejeonella sp. H1SJ63 TaxID=3034145 RepID=UPI0023EAFD64|nr:DUF1501 domain-containing protein [Daejeonella sp. H1SJ63]